MREEAPRTRQSERSHASESGARSVLSGHRSRGTGFADASLATLTIALAPYGKDAFATAANMASNVRPEIGECYQAVSVCRSRVMFGKTIEDNAADTATVSFLKGDHVVDVDIFCPSGGARGHVVAVAITAASRV